MHTGGHRGRAEVLPLFVGDLPEPIYGRGTALWGGGKKRNWRIGIELNVEALELPDKENEREKRKQKKEGKKEGSVSITLLGVKAYPGNRERECPSKR